MDASSLGKETRGRYDVADLGNEKSSFEEGEEDEGSSSSFGVMGMFSKLMQGKVIQKEDLEPVMDQMHEHLVQKNVASEIASHLCGSVEEGLVGSTIGTFQSKFHLHLSQPITPSHLSPPPSS